MKTMDTDSKGSRKGAAAQSVEPFGKNRRRPVKSPYTFAEIRARWRWDAWPVKATNDNINLAIRMTRNPFGIGVGGNPYISPFVGMPVVLSSEYKTTGKIVAVRKPMRRGGDPECEIELCDGRRVFLFQTAMIGYRPQKKPSLHDFSVGGRGCGAAPL